MCVASLTISFRDTKDFLKLNMSSFSAHISRRASVYDDAQGQRLTPQALAAQHPGPIDLWFCGPQGLGDALDAHAARDWRLHRESFAMR